MMNSALAAPAASAHPSSTACRTSCWGSWHTDAKTTIVALVVLLGSTHVCAQEASRASEDPALDDAATVAFWEGKDHYDRGDFQAALQRFLTSYQLSQDPDLLYNLAQTYRRLGQCRQSLEHYRRYVELSTPSSATAQAKAQIDLLQVQCSEQQELAEQHPATEAAPRHTGSSGVGSEREDTRTPTPRVPPKPQARQLPDESRGQDTPTYLRTASVATMVTGLALAGVGIGLKLWDDDRYATWKARDRELQPFREDRIVDPVLQERMQANNNLGRSILSTQKYELAAAIASGVFCASAITLYVLSINSTAYEAQSKRQSRPAALPSVFVAQHTGGVMLEGTLP